MQVTDYPVDDATVDAVLTASRTRIAVATRSLGSAAEDTTIAQYRTLVVLASPRPQRLVDLAGSQDVTPSTAGRMCDRFAVAAAGLGAGLGPGLPQAARPGARHHPERRRPGQPAGSCARADRSAVGRGWLRICCTPRCINAAFIRRATPCRAAGQVICLPIGD